MKNLKTPSMEPRTLSLLFECNVVWIKNGFKYINMREKADKQKKKKKKNPTENKISLSLLGKVHKK